MKKWFKRIFIAGFVLVTGFALVFFFYPFDIEEQDYSHLTRELKNIPKEENALYEYLAIHEELKEKGVDLFTIKKDKDKSLAFVKENKVLFYRLDKALEMRYEEPDFSEEFTLELGVLSLKQTVSNLLKIRFYSENETQRINKFSQQLLRASNSLVSELIVMSIEKAYGELSMRLVNKKGFDLKKVKLIEDELLIQSFNKALDSEKTYTLFQFKGIVEKFIDEDASFIDRAFVYSEYVYQENRFFKDYFKFLDEQKITGQEIYSSRSHRPDYWNWLFPGGGNKIIMYTATQGFDKSRGNSFESLCINKVAKVALACRIYEQDHNSLPKTLDDLVPQYLEKVPMDNFDGKPLKYDFESKKIYSVGRDGVDDGGSMYEGKYYGTSDSPNVSMSKDIVFQFAE